MDLEVKQLFLSGQICGDPLNVCTSKTKQTSNLTMKFDSSNMKGGSTILPAGYFCLYDEEKFTLNDDYTQFLYYNKTSENNEITVYAEYYWYKSIKSKHR